MQVRHIDHIQLAMPAGREDEARAFYQDVLGIPEVAKPPHLAVRGGCWFERGPLKVHLGVEQDFVPTRKKLWGRRRGWPIPHSSWRVCGNWRRACNARDTMYRGTSLWRGLIGFMSMIPLVIGSR